MKDLTIEEKATRYDKAIDVARKINSGEGVAAPSGWTTCEVIFPELRESEDERIRKELLEHCKNQAKPYIQTGNKCPQIQSWIDWLEKQGEQKTADKIEPKFKVGDWVVHDMSDGRKVIRQIVNMTNRSYVLDGEGFNTFYFNDLESDYHLWTIQDAKLGDVLREDSCTFLIKRMKPDGTAIVHCCLFDDGDFDLSSTLSFDVDSTYPATKEQRDLLFQKMKEAGYTFDFEKKELKKIIDEKQIKNNLQNNSFRRMFEKKSDNKVEPKFDIGDKIQYSKDCGTIMTIEKIENGEYIFADNMGHTTIESGNEWNLVEQNLVWSEEDDKIYYSLLADIRTRQDSSTNTLEAYYNDQIEWLKSLKDRVQPKQEWSKEDETNASYIVAALDCYYRLREERNNTNGQESLDKARNWLHNKLKSLRPQNKWKPSDERMKALHDLNLTGGLSNIG